MAISISRKSIGSGHMAVMTPPPRCETCGQMRYVIVAGYTVDGKDAVLYLKGGPFCKCNPPKMDGPSSWE